MWRSGLKWLFLILGTTIGAGYASGRELWQFFGRESVLAIGLFSLLFMISCFVLLKISYDFQSASYLPILKTLLGKRLTRLYDIMTIVYLFSTTVIMLAGGGATLQSFYVPYWVGIGFIAMLVVFLFFWNIEGILAMNALIIPGLILLLLSILVTYIISEYSGYSLDWQQQSNWPSAFTFTALNILPLVAVIAAIGSKIKHRGEIWIASAGSALILGGLSLLYNQVLVLVENDLMFYEIPLFAILQHYPEIMGIVMTILLWFAIFTTAVSGVFGLISRFYKRFQWPWWILALCLIVPMVPLTAFGFSNLIAFLYPLYGLLNLYLLAAIILYPIAKRHMDD